MPLVIDIIRRLGASGGRTLLGGGNVSREAYALAIATILKLGKNRVADVLALDCPSMLRRNILSSIKDSAFVGIGEDVILSILNNDDADVRKHCALKCAKTYSRSRLTALLDRYNCAEHTFYNVIHWLDFGLYSSKEKVKSACKKIFIV